MQTVEIDDLLPVGPTAKLLNVSTKWLERRRIDGDGPPYVKIGRRVGYLRADIMAWLAQRRFQSTAEAQRVGVL